MIRHTFCHLQGIGEKTELALWQAGITDWSRAEQAAEMPRMKRLAEQIAASEEALAEREWRFFKRVLGGGTPGAGTRRSGSERSTSTSRPPAGRPIATP